MNPLLDNMLQYVESYRYAAVFVFTFLGAFALPLPTGTLMIACGFLFTLGVFNLFPLLVIGLLGNLAGDHAGYWAARLLGPSISRVPILGRMVKSKKFQGVGQHVHDHPWVTIMFSRFMTAIAPSVNLVAGFTKYPYGKFWLFEGLGEMAEVGIYTALGVWFGNEWQKASEYAFVFWIIVAFGIFSSWFFWRWLGGKKFSSAKIFGKTN